MHVCSSFSDRFGVATNMNLNGFFEQIKLKKKRRKTGNRK